MSIRRTLPVVTVILLSWDLHAQLPYKRLVDAAQEPQNWLMYSGTYSSNRYSLLREIDATNAKALDLKWVFQAQSLNSFEATPLVVDGVMYLTQAPNDVVALDSKTGRIFWIYRHVNSSTPSPVVVLSIAGW